MQIVITANKAKVTNPTTEYNEDLIVGYAGAIADRLLRYENGILRRATAWLVSVREHENRKSCKGLSVLRNMQDRSFRLRCCFFTRLAIVALRVVLAIFSNDRPRPSATTGWSSCSHNNNPRTQSTCYPLVISVMP